MWTFNGLFECFNNFARILFLVEIKQERENISRILKWSKRVVCFMFFFEAVEWVHRVCKLNICWKNRVEKNILSTFCYVISTQRLKLSRVDETCMRYVIWSACLRVKRAFIVSCCGGICDRLGRFIQRWKEIIKKISREILDFSPKEQASRSSWSRAWRAVCKTILHSV